MKRYLAIIAALLAVITMLSACGSNDVPNPETTTEAVTETPGTTEEVTTGKPDDGFMHIDGKTILIIGNSFVYYGGYVENLNQFDGADQGMLYKVCQSFGDNVTVIERTFGGHSLSDFVTTCRCSGQHERSNHEAGGCPGMKTDLLKDIDLAKVDYVFMSESGSENAYLLKSCQDIMARFPNPDTKFFYLSHSYTYTAEAVGIINSLPGMAEAGIGIVEWGKLVYDVFKGTATVEGSTLQYTKDSFIVNKKDTHHPNPLSGYIAALMSYCAITGRTAVGADYSFVKDTKAGGGTTLYASLTDFKTEYYNEGTTNYDQVFASAADMTGLQKLIDKYLAVYAK